MRESQKAVDRISASYQAASKATALLTGKRPGSAAGGDAKWMSQIVKQTQLQAKELRTVEAITGRIIQNYHASVKNARYLSETVKNIGSGGLSEFAKMTGTASANTSKLGGQLKKTVDVHKKLDQAVAQTTSGYSMFSQAIMGTGQNIGNTQASLNKQQASLKAGQAHLAGFNSEAKKVAKTFADIGVTGRKSRRFV